MIRALLLQACRIAPVAFFATGVLVAVPSLAETAKKGPSVTADEAVKDEKDTAAETKPVPAEDKAEVKKDGAEKPVDGPSTGLSVLDRMGADLPALPA